MTRKLEDVAGYEELLHAALEGIMSDSRGLERAVHQLAHAHRMIVIGQLAASVAHDVNNHLAVVLSCAAHLEHRGTEPVSREAVAEMTEAAGRAAEVCRQMLDVVRARRPHARFEVNALLGRMAAFLTRLGTVSGAGQLEVDLLLSPDPGWIAGDEALFSNALLNLAANSRDAMPTGGRVALRTALVDVGPGVDRQLRVDVVDTGAGIPEELLPKVFDPFFTTKREGTGLGLCSVRRTVEGHGGSVKVASRVGEGTTVTILVPLADPP